MPPGSSDPPLAGVVLAGGSATRMSGADKPALVVGERTLLDGVLAALVAADPVVVVGPRRRTERTVTWAREDPPYSGPLAGVAAGLTAMHPWAPPDALVAVLAGDLAAVTPDTVGRLVVAIGPGADGAVLLDAGGRRQWLAGVWRYAALLRGLPDDPANRSVRSALGSLRVAGVPELPGESADVDTPEDVEHFWGGNRGGD